MSIRNLHILILVSVAYVAAQLVADISNLRNLTLFGLSVSAFSIAYPLTFTLRDMVHKLAGPNVARTLIIAAAVIYLVVQAFFTIISNLPPEMNEAERVTLGQLLSPEWRFLMAAVVASVLSQLVDTEVYTRWVGRFGQAEPMGSRPGQQSDRDPGRPDALFGFGLRGHNVDGGIDGSLHWHDARPVSFLASYRFRVFIWSKSILRTGSR